LEKKCSSSETPKRLTQLNNILHRGRNITLGLVKGPSETPATSPEESIGLLLDEHFPESKKIDDLTIGENDPSFTKLEDLGNDWLTVHRIQTAINFYSPYKVAGSDMLKPIVLQHLPECTL
jgi:hypothetical protein